MKFKLISILYIISKSLFCLQEIFNRIIYEETWKVSGILFRYSDSIVLFFIEFLEVIDLVNQAILNCLIWLDNGFREYILLKF